MEIPVFNSIIFGTLQPWQVENQNEQTFSDLLRSAGRTVPVTVHELNNKLQFLLRDHPDLFQSVTGKADDALPTPFYNIDLPAHFNTTTEYYLLLMQCSALQFMYRLMQQVGSTTHDDETYFLTNTTLERIKYIAAGAASELQRQHFTGLPAYEMEINLSQEETVKRNTHFILFAARQLSLRIFFEVQERLKEHVKEIETEQQFYLHTIKEAHPGRTPLTPIPAYFEWQAGKFISAGSFSLHDAVRLLHDTKTQGSTSPESIIALENFILANIFNLPVESTVIANLANSATSANFFEQVKQNVSIEINQHTYGYQRFDVITQASNKISFHSNTAVNNLSALTLLKQWLDVQAEAYKGNLSNSFAVVPDPKATLQKKAKPLPKTDKTSIENFKQQAQEFLQHFSGYNPQQKKIMSDAEHKRLLEYTFYLIEHEKLPRQINQIPKIGLSGRHIRYTFYLMHQAFYGTNEIKPVWIDFLKEVFQQLSSQDWQTLKTKFSVKPPNYDHDLSTMSTH